MRTSSLLVMALITGQALVARAAPQGAEAQSSTITEMGEVAFRAGLDAFGTKDYDTAVEQLEIASRLMPQSDVFFAWGQAERLRGNCAAAVSLYEQFVELAASEVEASRANEHLARCQEFLPEPWYRDWIGHGLIAPGLLSVGLGSLALSASNGSRDAAERATAYEDYRARMDDAQTQRRGAIAGLTLGGTLTVAAVVHYLWFASAQTGEQASAWLPLSDGTAMAWRF